ncbi:unnamed protein product [Pleuronectes platessa]|uniref:Uncharacterized protein n=1 Tax=Pleuronectes platessa TaxID=8262 RepID=A0A9N7TVN5_PLEPL|nr:unnamed protein product [Pleuronectes platessa]
MQVIPQYLLTHPYWKAMVLKVVSEDPHGVDEDFQAAQFTEHVGSVEILKAEHSAQKELLSAEGTLVNFAAELREKTQGDIFQAH